jgi:predicted membrane channel-forming protein YqfA (hemolysin III family)
MLADTQLEVSMSDQHPTLWQMILSVVAAIFGVQSEKNRERDFTKGSLWPYVLLGAISLIVFVVMVILLTSWALSLAGA